MKKQLLFILFLNSIVSFGQATLIKDINLGSSRFGAFNILFFFVVCTYCRIKNFKSKENLSNAYNNQKNMLQERQSALEARENQFINNNILVQFSDSIVGGGDFAVIDDEGNDQCDTGETEEDDVDRTDTRMIVIEDGEIKNDPRTNQEELFDIEDIGKKCDETQDIELITDSEIVIDSSTNNNKQEFYYIKEAHNFLKNRREEAYKKFEEQTKPYYDKLHEELVLNSDLWKDWNKKQKQES